VHDVKQIGPSEGNRVKPKLCHWKTLISGNNL